MSLADDINLTMGTMEAHAPATVEIGGASYPCVTSTEQRGTICVIGGKEYETRVTVWIRKSHLPSPLTADTASITADTDQLTADHATKPPTSGQRVKSHTLNYRILGVTTDPERRSFYRLELGDVVSAR